MDSTLCKNNGQCVDESTNKRGFRCLCSMEYQGEYCEKRNEHCLSLIKKENETLLNDLGVELTETTERTVDTSTEDLLQLAHRLK